MVYTPIIKKKSRDVTVPGKFSKDNYQGTVPEQARDAECITYRLLAKKGFTSNQTQDFSPVSKQVDETIIPALLLPHVNLKVSIKGISDAYESARTSRTDTGELELKARGGGG